jgi:hypothetical protein
LAERDYRDVVVIGTELGPLRPHLFTSVPLPPAAVMSGWKCYVHERGLERNRGWCDEVRQVAETLAKNGIPPTGKRSMAAVGTPGAFSLPCRYGWIDPSKHGLAAWRVSALGSFSKLREIVPKRGTLAPRFKMLGRVNDSE